MKEQFIKQLNKTSFSEITYHWCKHYFPKVNRASFHKICDELIKDKLLAKRKVSNVWFYRIIK